jgi:site-specific DNA recombinase
MSKRSSSELVPRNGHTLLVGIGARISGCANQKEMSLDDQVDHGKQEVTDLYSGPVEYRIVATKGKGEALDRPELAQIEAEYRKGEMDLYIFEDLGRLVRGAEAVRLLGIGVDHGTRTIAPNDCVDTAAETWEEDALHACAAHVAHNAHTSKRIKHKSMNRFIKHGGCPGRPIYGYIVSEGVKTYDGWLKDESAISTIQTVARQLKETLNCSLAADTFNRLGAPTGPYCRKEKWDGKMVRRFFANTLLKGMPCRGGKATVKRHETGRRVSIKNPGGERYYKCDHLVILEEAEFDDLNRNLTEHFKNRGRKPVDGVDPRFRVPRKRTRFPGQHGQCWYCGRHHVWGANGMTGNLQCSGSREWLCWNSIGYSGELAIARVRNLILSQLFKLEGIDQQFQKMIQAADQCAGGDITAMIEKLQKEEDSLAVKKKNAKAAIIKFGDDPLVGEMLSELKMQEREIARRRDALRRRQDHKLELPQSTAALRHLIEEQFHSLAMESGEFAHLLRTLVPTFQVYLVRLCDGGHLLPRARVKLALDGIAPDAAHVPGLPELLTSEHTIDLFDPPQRERIRVEAVALAATGMGLKKIAETLAEKPTSTAVQSALALDRKMHELALTTPYVTLTMPPDDYAKLRRHRNKKYFFAPSEGYTPPSLR